MSNDDSRAQKALTNPAQLQATLNVIPAHTWYAASSGGLTFVNKRTADYLSLPKDHPLRFGIDIDARWDAHIPLLHLDDHERTRKVWSTCLRTGVAGVVSFRVRNAQGGYRWFLSRAEPLRASDGTLLQWVGVNLDIEELNYVEQVSREPSTNPLDNRRLRRILEYIEEHLADDIAVADLANIACLSIFHFTRAFCAAIGMPPHRYVGQRRLERARAMIAAESTSIAETAFVCRFDMAQILKISLATVSSRGAHRTLRFGPFELLGSKRVLRRDGVTLPIGSRAFDILVYLAERPGKVIRKKELIDHVWPNVTVEEGSLRVHVAAIRKALGDGQFGNRYIANVKGIGYSFIGSVVRLEES